MILFVVVGKLYLIEVDEGGGGGFQDLGVMVVKVVCNVGVVLFLMGYIYDMFNEVVLWLVLEFWFEMYVIVNCSQVIFDIIGLIIFMYGVYYCSVDNWQNVIVFVCSYFNFGICVFDICDLLKLKEIVYYNLVLVKLFGVGLVYLMFGQYCVGGLDWCVLCFDFDFDCYLLIIVCQDNGMFVLLFENDSWLFFESMKVMEIGN